MPVLRPKKQPQPLQFSNDPSATNVDLNAATVALKKQLDGMRAELSTQTAMPSKDAAENWIKALIQARRSWDESLEKANIKIETYTMDQETAQQYEQLEYILGFAKLGLKKEYLESLQKAGFIDDQKSTRAKR